MSFAKNLLTGAIMLLYALAATLFVLSYFKSSFESNNNNLFKDIMNNDCYLSIININNTSSRYVISKNMKNILIKNIPACFEIYHLYK